MTSFVIVTGLVSDRPIHLAIHLIVMIAEDDDGHTAITMMDGNFVLCKETPTDVRNGIYWQEKQK